MSNTPSTIEYKLTVVSKTPPPRNSSHLTPRVKSDLQVMIESLKAGTCLEYRGPLPYGNIAGRIGRAKKANGKTYALRKAEGGMDIYCTAEPTPMAAA